MLALCVVDSGASRTMICKKTCEALGLTITYAREGEFGTYRVPGEEKVKPYLGIVKGPVALKLHEQVVFGMCNVRVLDHPMPLFLLGSDVLRGGRVAHEWNYNGVV